jgi:hypothetical protein
MVSYWVHLRPAEARQLDDLLRRYGQSPIQLIHLLVRQFLSDSRRASPPIGLLPEQATVVTKRLVILRGWELALATGQGSREAKTAKYLRMLLIERGLSITWGTLYNWKRRFERSGSAGLIDHRSLNRNARTASGGRRRRAKRASKPV